MAYLPLSWLRDSATWFVNLVENCSLFTWNNFFNAPSWIDWGHMVFDIAVCPSVCFFVRKNFYIGHISQLVIVRAFILHMSISGDNTFLLVPSSISSVKVKVERHTSIPWDNTFLLVPSSISSVKVKVEYQGQNFQKNSRCGGIRVSQTHFICFVFLYDLFLLIFFLKFSFPTQNSEIACSIPTSNSALGLLILLEDSIACYGWTSFWLCFSIGKQPACWKELCEANAEKKKNLSRKVWIAVLTSGTQLAYGFQHAKTDIRTFA